MPNRIWPASLRTPHIPLGVALDYGFEMLKQHGEILRVDDENEARVYRTSTDDFSMAIYEQNGIVQSVWYDDPAGRLLGVGKQKKSIVVSGSISERRSMGTAYGESLDEILLQR